MKGEREMENRQEQMTFDQLEFGLVCEKETRTCSQCDYIHTVKFRRNMFFCRARKGWTYGKKIRKNDVACTYFKDATTKKIPRRDGYYGHELEGVRR